MGIKRINTNLDDILKQRINNRNKIFKKTKDIEEVFNQRWKANKNGLKQNIKENKEHFNKIHNIKSKEEKKREILEANSVNGRIKRLEEQMKAASPIVNNRNKFK